MIFGVLVGAGLEFRSKHLAWRSRNPPWKAGSQHQEKLYVIQIGSSASKRSVPVGNPPASEERLQLQSADPLEEGARQAEDKAPACCSEAPSKCLRLSLRLAEAFALWRVKDPSLFT